MKTLAFAIFMSISAVAVAQTFIGVKAGLNITDVNANVKMKPAFRTSGGFTFERFLGEKTSLGADFLFFQRGARVDLVFETGPNGPGAVTSDVHYNYDYLSLPIKVSRLFGEKRRIFGSVGLVPSFLLKAEAKLKNNRSGNTTLSDTKEELQNVKPFDLAGQVEGGLNFPMGDKYSLFGSAAFQYSINRVNEQNFFDGSNVRHYGFIISGGVKMKLGGN